MPKSSAPRNARQRERERRGVSVGQAEYDGIALTHLVQIGLLTEAECYDRAAINRALSAFIWNATRCAQ